MIKRIIGIVASAGILFVLIMVIANSGNHQTLLPHHLIHAEAEPADTLLLPADPLSIQDSLPTDTLPHRDSAEILPADTISAE